MGLRPSIVVAKGAFRRERSTPNGVRINEKRQFGAEIGKFALPESDKRWRRRGDSNPRDPFESNGFQDRRFQPLTHSSVSNSSVLRGLEGQLCLWDAVRLCRYPHKATRRPRSNRKA